MKKEQVNNFFKALKSESDLTIEKINDIVKNSELEKGWRKYILTRVKRHNNCEKEMAEWNKKTPFVVADYEGENAALECEGCYSVIIDDEILLCE